MGNNDKNQAKQQIARSPSRQGTFSNAEGNHEALPVRAEHWLCAKSLDNDVVVRQSSEHFVWGAVRKNIISDRFSTKTAISAQI